MCSYLLNYSHLSNNRGGWNKRGGGAKVAKSINVEVGINVYCDLLTKKVDFLISNACLNSRLYISEISIIMERL